MGYLLTFRRPQSLLNNHTWVIFIFMCVSPLYICTLMKANESFRLIGSLTTFWLKIWGKIIFTSTSKLVGIFQQSWLTDILFSMQYTAEQTDQIRPKHEHSRYNGAGLPVKSDENKSGKRGGVVWCIKEQSLGAFPVPWGFQWRAIGHFREGPASLWGCSFCEEFRSFCLLVNVLCVCLCITQ